MNYTLIKLFQYVFLPTVPFFVPVVHIALMGSVYSTIVMSLERYLRICRVQVSLVYTLYIMYPEQKIFLC